MIFFSWPYVILGDLPRVIFGDLHLYFFHFPVRGNCQPLPHREPIGHSLWLTVSRPNTPDWKLTPAKLTVSAVGIYNFTVSIYNFTVSAVGIYNFTTPMNSGCHPRDKVPLIYTGECCNHIVYTAGTSGFVKGQYATPGFEPWSLCLFPTMIMGTIRAYSYPISINFEQVNSNYKRDPYMSYHSRLKWEWKQ